MKNKEIRVRAVMAGMKITSETRIVRSFKCKYHPDNKNEYIHGTQLHSYIASVLEYDTLLALKPCDTHLPCYLALKNWIEI